LDVLENFHGSKNALLGVNGNPGSTSDGFLIRLFNDASISKMIKIPLMGEDGAYNFRLPGRFPPPPNATTTQPLGIGSIGLG